MEKYENDFDSLNISESRRGFHCATKNCCSRIFCKIIFCSFDGKKSLPKKAVQHKKKLMCFSSVF